MDAWLQRVWYGRSAWTWLLLPLTVLFWLGALLRRLSYRAGLLRTERVGKPVIVVGNISVGGTGKTPLVIWLVRQLGARGLRCAVITRGYGGKATRWPQQVRADSDAGVVGDEAVLIARRANCIVVAGPDRVASAREAISHGAEVIVSDDGLQHYRLARDFEIAVIDGARGFGNGWLLPAGPLRESVGRLRSVNAVVATEYEAALRRIELARFKPLFAMRRIDTIESLREGKSLPLAALRGKRAHAVAGIGNPDAFFAMLRHAGIDVDGRALADHADIGAADLQFADDAPVLMTEKDAVKCRAVAHANCWVVPLEMEVAGADSLLANIDALVHHAATATH